ncbi:MAG: glycosyltransferase family 4 protein [Candidatus Omnitrophica bacterium]|nr:glycosyltransferase family 4 protein [Candidatus Omnitrophota bacterium]
MKILINSYAFYPSFGGSETVALILADEFVRLGFSVKVITSSVESLEDNSFPFEIIRKYSLLSLIGLLKWSDVFLQNNISLRTAFALAIVRRPWFIIHHSYLGWDLFSLIKRAILKLAVNVVIKENFPIRSKKVYIPNPYNDEIFKEVSSQLIKSDLIFVGRLIKSKGLESLLSSLSLLKDEIASLSLTVVGQGCDKAWFIDFAGKNKLMDRVSFLGYRPHKELAYILRQHKVLIVPSKQRDNCPLVCTEALACGLQVIISDKITNNPGVENLFLSFKADNILDLSRKIKLALSFNQSDNDFLKVRNLYLSQRRKKVISEKYRDLFEKYLNNDRK